jgi:hypothetical protein
MLTNSCPPILFLIFNRPDLTAKVFSAIKGAKPTRLFIAADGPRYNISGEDIICYETRKVTEKIDWDCEVHRLYRDANLGCKLAVSSAITWFFEHVESGIILEDDCLPTLSFFSFCSELLERYKDRDDIGIIGGSCSFRLASNPSESYYFSKYPHIWGWATWRKVWQHYDVNLDSWDGNENSLLPHLNNRMVRKHWVTLFDSVKNGEVDTWDYQLAHLCLALKRLSISPTVNLVTNIGFDERATHTIACDASRLPPEGKEIPFPLSHPGRFEADETIDQMDETESWRIPTSETQVFIRQAISNMRVIGGKILRSLKLK